MLKEYLRDLNEIFRTYDSFTTQGQKYKSYFVAKWSKRLGLSIPENSGFYQSWKYKGNNYNLGQIIDLFKEELLK